MCQGLRYWASFRGASGHFRQLMACVSKGVSDVLSWEDALGSLRLPSTSAVGEPSEGGWSQGGPLAVLLPVHPSPRNAKNEQAGAGVRLLCLVSRTKQKLGHLMAENMAWMLIKESHPRLQS